MPAVTLGFEEIEDRLQTVRRRVNLFALQHIGYLAISALALTAAAVIVAALRGSPRTFSVTLFVALATASSTVPLTPLLIVRRWRNVQTVAALVDRRGDLQDRIVTLLAARDRQPPARLAGFLMADALALGRRWEPHVIAPRRVPRSIYLFLAALIALASTALLSRQPPPPAGGTTIVGGGAAPNAAPPQAGTQLAGPLPNLTQARSEQSREPPGDAAPGATFTTSPSGDHASLGNGAGDSSELDAPGSSPAAEAFGHQLQQLIKQAFSAEAVGRPQQLAQRSDRRVQSDGDRDGHAQGGRQPDSRNQDRGAPRAGVKGTDQTGNHSGNAHANGSNRDDNANRPNQGGNQPPQVGQAGNPGKGSGAGGGSAGGGLLAAKGGSGTGAGGELKTFKVTLVSFLQSASVKPAPEPKSPRGHVGDDGVASATHGNTTPSEQQLSDDLLRKPEIPPEFEEIVRRVYSQRPEP